MQEADGVGFRIVRTQRVGAHKFGQPVGLVGRRWCGCGRISCRITRHALRGDLPGRLRSGEAAADDMD